MTEFLETEEALDNKWSTEEDEAKYLGACLEYFGPVARKTEKLFRLLSCGVDETWFTDENNRFLFLGIFAAALKINNTAIVRQKVIIDETEKMTNEKGWAFEQIKKVSNTIGYLDLETYLKEDLPLWWNKLKKPKVTGIIGSLDRKLNLEIPTAERLDEITQLLSKAVETWNAEPSTSINDETPFSDFRNKILEPIPTQYRIPTGLKVIDEVLAGGFSDCQSPDRGKLIIFCARPGMGKAQRNSEPVLLADGTWKKIGEMKLGDEIASVKGTPSKVIGVFPQGKKKTVKITFKDGRSTICCKEHLWEITSSKWDYCPRVVDTSELITLLSKVRYKNRICVKTFDGYFGTETNLPIKPWLLGFLLGDGSFSGGSVSVTTSYPLLIDKVKKLLPDGVTIKPTGKIGYYLTREVGVGVSPLLNSIQEMGLFGCKSHNKFIPDLYKTCSREQRLELLRGLMDSDGMVANANGTLIYSTASKKLAKDVAYLVRSLGGNATTKIHDNRFYFYKGERKQGKDSFEVTINIIDNPFSPASHKHDQVIDRSHLKAKYSIITSAEETNNIEECTCIMVSNPDHLYITKDFIVTHNTLIATNLATRVAEQNKKVVFWTFEMSRDQLIHRIIAQKDFFACRENNWDDPITYKDIKERTFTPDQRKRLETEEYKAYEGNIHIQTGNGDTTAEAICRHMKAYVQINPNPGTLIIDHLGLLKMPNNNNRAIAVGEATRTIKVTATELGIDVVLLCQLNRALEHSNRDSRVPTLSDLRDSGRIEEDADVVMGLYRPFYYSNDPSEKHDLEIHVLKNRQGDSSFRDTCLVDLNSCAIQNKVSLVPGL